MDMVADRVWESRKRTFVHKNDGATINHTTAICHLGGATLDNEENYLIKKLFTGAWGWCAYPTRHGYDIAARCPVWAPPSAGAELRPRNKICNADCILIEGSSMAEAHPVGFRWVMKAKERGATIIHVDPQIFAHERAGRYLGADSRRWRHRLSRRPRSAHH